MTAQAIAPFDIALWDLKAKRAGLPLAKLLGAHRDSVQCYNTSGGFLSTPLEQVLKNVDMSRESGIGGIKIKVGQPDVADRPEAREGGARAARRRLPADGRRQPAMGPADRATRRPPRSRRST